MNTTFQLRSITAVLLLAFCACAPRMPSVEPLARPADVGTNDIAESYVRLVLAVGNHDDDYVDTYYGPPEWRTEAQRDTMPLPAILSRADSLLAALAATRPDETVGDMVAMRHQYLTRQLQALRARVEILGGRRMSFDEESRALYDAVAPAYTAEQFQLVLDRLNATLPGQGSVAERYQAFRSGFVIPRERVDTVFRAAVDACRERTERHIRLPADERFTIEFVTGKSWSGYNWYQGDFRSLMQVNMDLPIYIDRALDLACHEGYPGHHVYSMLLEQNMVRDRGWVEFSVYPLFSPQSLIAEGSANFGIDMAFPGEERTRFERERLFPLAGLDPAGAARYNEVQQLVRELGHAGNAAARQYLDGQITREQAAEWLVRYALMTPQAALQRTRFMDQYRSYVINYNLGQDLVRRHVELEAGSSEERRWEVFARLLSSPMLPSDLKR